MLYFDTGRFGEAVPFFREALGGYEKRTEAASVARTAHAHSYLGLALLGGGKPADAQPHLLAGYDALTRLKKIGPEDLARMRMVVRGLIESHEQTGRPAVAAEWRAKLKALPPEVAPPPRPVK